ncbi:acetylglutamate kinase [Enterococcus cecorum]|uniref:acetylglutamate kinase n=1 Tax=Enterococcus cecorum TaxID=44008 RepID=UPI001FAB890A|nr:acetylglutamate kinase [Enterococcus cecorum]MCJ0601745.1 acetylglutamate kinase [Enterococcus cecorum]
MKTYVVKIGGVASDQLNAQFFSTIRKWQAQGIQIVIIHGGGHYITELMEQFQIKRQIKNGLRVTDETTLELTKMALLGQVQPRLVSLFQKEGLQPVSLHAGCDQLIQGKVINYAELGYVGQVTAINHQLLKRQINHRKIPVIAPLGITKDGQWLNINADEVACKIASSIQADELFLLTDVPGIKENNQWLKRVNLSKIEMLKNQNIITGGMIPKLNSAKYTLLHGVKSVNINNNIHCFGTKITA